MRSLNASSSLNRPAETSDDNNDAGNGIWTTKGDRRRQCAARRNTTQNTQHITPPEPMMVARNHTPVDVTLTLTTHRTVIIA
jgi:hypothetical protein